MREDLTEIHKMLCNLAVEDPEVVAEQVSRMHRTHQQMFMNSVIACLRMWAKCHQAGIYDLRNEATCEVAKDIVEKAEHFGPRGSCYLPMI
jgi:hypothetical protein